ncbi:helix-turn-helix domain-containing protein [Paludibacterium yongneupense]|uniref:helix-turn-helix domain-containing protein n=1 Tax=Paludibacterium yongneupense TaxID=400061 RepID=UPI0004156514|nr:helix-turn-helix domain-containing protein [Paludibacterium yongneupense]
MSTLPSVLTDAAGCDVRVASRIRDLHDHARLFSDWNLHYDQISCGRFEGSICEARLDGIQIVQEQLSQSVFQTGPARPGTINLGVFRTLSGEARWSGKLLTLDHVTCLGQASELLLRTPQTSHLLMISLPCSMLGLDQYHCPPATVENRALAEGLRQRIESTLLAMMHHPLVFLSSAARRQFCSDATDLVAAYLRVSSPDRERMAFSKARRVVSCTRELLEASGEQILTVDDLCKKTYTSRRTLQNCFEQVTGISPAAFLKIIRLNNVRNDLSRAGGQVRVSDVATRWGFWHLSQFAVDYKRLFGEQPRQTIRASRL